jgi:hypothetical protein
VMGRERRGSDMGGNGQLRGPNSVQSGPLLFSFYVFIGIRYLSEVSLCRFRMCSQCTLVIFTSCIILPHPPLLLRTIATGFIVLPSYKHTKYIHHIHASPPFTLSPPCKEQRRVFAPASFHPEGFQEEVGWSRLETCWQWL